MENAIHNKSSWKNGAICLGFFWRQRPKSTKHFSDWFCDDLKIKKVQFLDIFATFCAEKSCFLQVEHATLLGNFKSKKSHPKWFLRWKLLQIDFMFQCKQHQSFKILSKQIFKILRGLFMGEAHKLISYKFQFSILIKF